MTLDRIRDAKIMTKVILGSMAGAVLYAGLSWLLNDPISWLHLVTAAVVTGVAIIVLVPRGERGTATHLDGTPD